MQRRHFLAQCLVLRAATGLCGALGVASSARSADVPPAVLVPALPNAVLAGSARMRFWGLDIYDARLWITPGFQPSAYWQNAFALELTYLRSLSGKAMAQRSLYEMRRIGTVHSDAGERWLHAMNTVFPDVQVGDRLTGLHLPGQGARFWLNEEARPPVQDPEFSRLFFGIWLADNTSEPRLRAALLAGQTS